MIIVDSNAKPEEDGDTILLPGKVKISYGTKGEKE